VHDRQRSGDVGCGLLEHLQPLATHRGLVAGKTGDIAARASGTGYKTATDRVDSSSTDDSRLRGALPGADIPWIFPANCEVDSQIPVLVQITDPVGDGFWSRAWRGLGLAKLREFPPWSALNLEILCRRFAPSGRTAKRRHSSKPVRLLIRVRVTHHWCFIGAYRSLSVLVDA
jgi:hypothetical protein